MGINGSISVFVASAKASKPNASVPENGTIAVLSADDNTSAGSITSISLGSVTTGPTGAEAELEEDACAGGGLMFKVNFAKSLLLINGSRRYTVIGTSKPVVQVAPSTDGVFTIELANSSIFGGNFFPICSKSCLTLLSLR